MTKYCLIQLGDQHFPDKAGEILDRSNFFFAAALIAIVLLGAQAPSAQGFGYSPAIPDIPTVKVEARGRLSTPQTPNRYVVTFEATTNRDGAGFTAGSPVRLDLGYSIYRRNNRYTETTATDVCTDYVPSSASCSNGWQAASSAGRSYALPSMPGGSDVVPRTLGIRLRVNQYEIPSGRDLGPVTGVAEVAYFLVPAADAFYRDGNGNEVSIWRQRAANTGSQLNKPLLIAEGIDIGDMSETDQYFGQLGSLANGLRNGGYDVAVVSFGRPLESVEVHEGGFRNAVSLVHSLKANPTMPTSVLGLSRGGVVARYALAKMEELGVEHHTSLFISYDSPQRGANINGDLQYRIYKNLGSTPDGAVVLNQFKSDAVRELLIDHIENRSVGDYATGVDKHAAFYNRLEALNNGEGYPINLRRVAWSNGSWITPTFNGDTFVYIDVQTNGFDKNVLLSNLDRQPGSFLPISFTGLVDGRSGDAADPFPATPVIKAVAYALDYILFLPTFGTAQVGTDYNVSVRNTPTFIPTSSALDQDSQTATTKFNRVGTANARNSHDAVPPEAVTLLLQELGLISPPPALSVSISGPYSLPYNNTGTWTANATGSTGGYGYTWDYSNVSCGGGGPLEIDSPPVAEISVGAATDLAEGSISPAPGGGPPTTNGLPCNEWYYAGSSSRTLARSFPTGDFQIRVTVTSGGQTTSSTRTISSGGGGGTGARMASGSSVGTDAASARFGTASIPLSLPEAYAFRPAIPNPSSGRALFSYDLPEASEVRLVIVDLLGREVTRLVEARVEAGTYEAVFEGSNLPAGVYVARLQAGTFAATRTFTLTR